MTDARTPAQAWAALVEGNDRFVAGEMSHPAQDFARRSEVSSAQAPFAVLFGCSDSRVPSEIIFDRGLGDMFVVRTAGHVVDTTVLGSIEFGVAVLGAPLVVVLGHSGCGAIKAARESVVTGVMPGGMVRAIVDRVIPSIVLRAPVHAPGSTAAPEPTGPVDVALPDLEELGREHVRDTVHMLGTYSRTLAEAVAAGKCAIVGAEYTLADGRARVLEVLGDVGLV